MKQSSNQRASTIAKPDLNTEVYCDRGGKHRWRIRANNGKIIAVSGESFASKRNAERAYRGFVDGLFQLFVDEATARITARIAAPARKG